MAACLTGSLRHRDGLAVARGAIDDAEEIAESSADWQGANNINMDVLESFVWEWEFPNFWPDGVWFGALTWMARFDEVFDLCF